MVQYQSNLAGTGGRSGSGWGWGSVMNHKIPGIKTYHSCARKPGIIHIKHGEIVIIIDSEHLMVLWRSWDGASFLDGYRMSLYEECCTDIWIIINKKITISSTGWHKPREKTKKDELLGWCFTGSRSKHRWTIPGCWRLGPLGSPRDPPVDGVPCPRGDTRHDGNSSMIVM